MTTIKICGLSEEATLRAAIDAGANMVGFVHFAQSPRHVTLERASILKVLLPAAVKSVIVTVDPDDTLMDAITSIVSPDFVQLHGHETPARVADIRRRLPKQKLIKALPVASGDDIAKAHAFAAHVDMLMFDAKPPSSSGLPGGNGLSFDWALMKNRTFALPWILSGGLSAENVREAIQQSGATAVDVSSGVESSPGVKDAALIQQFITNARKA